MTTHRVSSILSLSVLIVITSHSQSNGQQSCGPRMSARMIQDIPCDMSRSSYCTSPGSAYPWASVKRYIYENQGFMKRMYGDMRQSVILKGEMDDIREKYDSIYFFGRSATPVSKGSGSFGPRSMQIEDTINEDHVYEMGNTSSSMPNESNVSNNTSSNYSSQSSSSSSSSSTASSSFSSSSPLNENLSYSVEAKETTSKEQESNDNNNEFDGTAGTSTESNTLLHEMNELPSVLQEQFASPITPQPQVQAQAQAQTSEAQDVPTPTTTSASDKTSEEDDKEKEPRKGVNACPVKEEVVAPYWANNTRGETLALLNVYPFEQYVHWEKCAYENEQMFCRDGCRCEQQYRLHRLLAFDPKNDCRGVFADWFRFPSCCVCICYDLPENGFLRINRRRARL